MSEEAIPIGEVLSFERHEVDGTIDLSHEILYEKVADCKAEALEKIKCREPFSFIRYSHCEGKFLNLGGIQVKEIDIHRTLKRQFGYTDVTQEGLNEIAKGMRDSAIETDWAGLPDLKKIGSGFQREDLGNFLYALSVSWFEKRDREAEDRRRYCPLTANMRLLGQESLAEMVSFSESVCLVGCRDLRKEFSNRFGKPVTFISVPEAARTRGEAAVERHFPEAYGRIIEEIRTQVRPGTLVLVGAGVLGKIYAMEARRAGGVAIDAGSIFDLWAGVASRNGHSEEVLKSWRLSAAVDR